MKTLICKLFHRKYYVNTEIYDLGYKVILTYKCTKCYRRFIEVL
jgi:hypothetical protein